MSSPVTNNQRPTTQFDAIVVGSGISGGWAAKELCERGLKVLLLERGREVIHGKDYVNEHKAAWDLPHKGLGDRNKYREEYPVQSECYAFTEWSKPFWVNDKEQPYEVDEGGEFLWFRGNQLGGRSLLWARQCYRWSDLDFGANLNDGHGVDWPIRYKDIEPWYSYVEKFAGISGRPEGMSQLPDGEFLPPMMMNVAEQKIKSGIESAYPDRRMTIGRAAVLTQEHLGRAACHYCGPCQNGCSTGSYFSSQSSTLPAALATGNLTIQCDAIVESVLYDETNDRAKGVRYIDAKSKESRELEAKIIFLCASTLGTTQIMLNSKSNRFPTGIANSSGVLGHYLMDHLFEAGARGEVPGLDDKYTFGNRPNGIYLMRFRNLLEGRQQNDFVRGYAYQGSAYRSGWKRAATALGIGADYKNSIREPGPWMMDIEGYCEMLPNFDNYAYLDESKTDQWGIPILRINCLWGENELTMMQDAMTQAAEMLVAAGCKNVETYNYHPKPGRSIHEMGTARMGNDPKTSILNQHNQCHDVPNLFVTDGSVMTSSACQNPSITYMALTARACAYAVSIMQ